ncbi:MAG: hypothetical protein COA78_38730 [Blastopirellula sp.]|nr:MAG: hypothetical protein COA78_38730 [Blastopirellula sp.]
MERLKLTLVAFLLILPVVQAQQQKQPKPTAEHAAIIAELKNEPIAMRYFKLNEQGEIIWISLCGHLSPADILAVKKLTTLKTLIIEGRLPFSRFEGTPVSMTEAENRRHKLFPLALPQLGALTSIEHLQLHHVPSAEEMQVVASWNKLESLSGYIPPELYPGIAKLTKLRRLDLTANPFSAKFTKLRRLELTRKHTQPISPQFLAPLSALESLSLPPGFRDNTFTHLADKQRLEKIEGEGLSGEALVDYLMEKRGHSLLDALKGAGYSVKADESGKLTKLRFSTTKTFDRLYSEKVLNRLPDLREMELYDINERDDQLLQAIRGRPLESLSVAMPLLPSSIVTEICKVKSLKHLSLIYDGEQIKLPAISGLPVLESLSLRGVNGCIYVPEIRDLPKLVQLTVHDLEINREQVEQFQQLPSLKHLDLARGTVSHAAVEGIASMTQLESLDLTETDIGDEQLALLRKLVRLKTLSMKKTNVSVNARARFLREHLGMDPVGILEEAGVWCRREDSKQITHVSFRRKCGSELIRSAAELPAVWKLTFFETPLDEDTLIPLEMMSRVKEVEFSGCKTLDDDMIAQLAKMPALQTLKFSGTPLGECTLIPLKMMSCVTSLEFSNCKTLDDDMVVQLAKMPALRKLKFHRTPLGEDTLNSLEMMSRVTELEFFYCKTLDDDMIAQLAKMPALRTLKIVNSGLSDDSKGALLKLTQLENLEIKGKSISPSIVAEIRKELPNIVSNE